MDADLAQNTSGCNGRQVAVRMPRRISRVQPMSQGEKFDPHGDYVRSGVRNWRNFRMNGCTNRGRHRPLFMTKRV